MRIVVLSDTHIPVSAAELPMQVNTYLRDCDLIIHAGDIVDISVFKKLEEFAEIRAVHGNMDSGEVKRRLPDRLTFTVCGKSIGVIHGKGSSAGAVQSARKAFTEKLDIVIFGHSHVPYNQEIDGTLFFNPGSVTDRICAPYRSFGLITIDGDEIKAEIVRID